MRRPIPAVPWGPFVSIDRHWTFHAAGSCEGLVVNVHQAGTGGVVRLPTREYEYEAPAAIVLERRGGWFKVQLVAESAWMPAHAASGEPTIWFHSRGC